jgi:integrase
MPERYQLMILLASWCGLRFGEIAELRRSDVDLTNGVIRVRRGVVRTADGHLVKGPSPTPAVATWQYRRTCCRPCGTT